MRILPTIYQNKAKAPEKAASSGFNDKEREIVSTLFRTRLFEYAP